MSGCFNRQDRKDSRIDRLSVGLIDARWSVDKDPKEEAMSNQFILMVTCILFALFVAAEIVGALAGNSLSLLGDAAAMSVDVFTYFTNMYAERIKASGKEIDENTRMMLEVFIPSFSVCALLAVTAYVTSEAIAVIMDNGDDDDTNVYFLYGFASGNMLIDAISAYLFYRKKDDIFVSKTQSGKIETEVTDENGYKTKVDQTVTKSTVNLNMISAFTHVGGDTMRTLSVFVAAVIVSCTNISSGLLDAWAAVVVTITIVIAVIPLVIEIIAAAKAHFYPPLLDNVSESGTQNSMGSKNYL